MEDDNPLLPMPPRSSTDLHQSLFESPASSPCCPCLPSSTRSRAYSSRLPSTDPNIPAHIEEQIAASTPLPSSRRRRPCTGSNKLSTTLAVLSVMMLAISLCVIPGINMVLHSQIKEQLLVDSSSSPSYSTWVSNADPASDSNLDVTYDVYMWSVANPSAVLHDNAKPQMVQMGPYSYKVSSRPPPHPPDPPPAVCA